MRATDLPERHKADELREAVANEERRLAELGDETRRAESRLDTAISHELLVEYEAEVKNRTDFG